VTPCRRRQANSELRLEVALAVVVDDLDAGWLELEPHAGSAQLAASTAVASSARLGGIAMAFSIIHLLRTAG
jgi:hypothetical protein